NPRAWALSIVRNAAYSWLAKNRPAAVVLAGDLGEEAMRRAEDAASSSPGDAETPEAALIAKSEADSIRARMGRLPPPFAEVLVLREIHDPNYRESAAIVDGPVGPAMSRLARARRLLTGDEEASRCPGRATTISKSSPPMSTASSTRLRRAVSKAA